MVVIDILPIHLGSGPRRGRGVSLAEGGEWWGGREGSRESRPYPFVGRDGQPAGLMGYVRERRRLGLYMMLQFYMHGS